MTHAELCHVTAQRFSSEGDLTLVEYQSFASSEFPDVLVFGNGFGTTLYEIKVSRSDFFSDQRKEARRKWKSRASFGVTYLHRENKAFEKALLQWKTDRPELFFIQKPHLGSKRFYVCESGLLKPEEIPEGWGLYWVKNGRFYRKKESGLWRANVRMERDIAVHALRRYAHGLREGILVKSYQRPVIEERK